MLFGKIIVGMFIFFLIAFVYGQIQEMGPKEDLSGLCNEINMNLRVVQEFKNSDYWKEETGSIYISPAYERTFEKHMEFEHINIEILLFERDERDIKFCSKGFEIADYFELVNKDNTYFYKIQTIGSYQGGNQRVLSKIYKSILDEFPNVEIEKGDRGLIIKNI